VALDAAPVPEAAWFLEPQAMVDLTEPEIVSTSPRRSDRA
jgi:hypothetical protein